MINWHRLFGILLCDYFSDSPYSVELEKDLSVQQQFLDVVILRSGDGEFSRKLPDGLDNLSQHNLLSYKSLRESLDLWAIYELIGHYVNYRKQSGKKMPPESEFSLYAVSTRYPQKLAKQMRLIELSEGVYDLKDLGGIRLIVLKQIPKAKHNALWHLFSDNIDKIKYGIGNHDSKIPVSTIVNVLSEHYHMEELLMAYTLEDFHKDVARKNLHFLTADEILDQLSTDGMLNQVPADKILKHYSLSERLQGLSKEDIKAYLAQQDEPKADSKH